MAFLYPSFLFALAAVAVPVILHLVQLRRARRILFSNVQFIQVSKELTASQRNLRELLILLSRIGFITCLVFAFAQPYLPASNAGALAEESDVGIIVDNSYSMQNLHEAEDLTLLQVAADRAKEITALFPASASFLLATTERLNHGAPVQANEADAFLEAVDYSAKSSLPATLLKQRLSHLFLLSDFQKQTFNPAILAATDSATHVHLLPLAATATANITIDSVYLEDEFIRGDAENTLHVVLNNTSTEEVTDVPVRLFVQGEQVSVLSIDLPARQTTQATLAFRVAARGTKEAYVQVEDYPVEFDNTYYFTLTPSAPVAVVEINNGQLSVLQQLYGNEPFFRYKAYNRSNVDYAQLAAANIVIINGVLPLPEGVAAAAAAYVQDGGVLVVLPPAGQETGGYTALFQGLNLSVSFTGASQEEAKTSLAAPDPKHPFFRSIFSDFDPDLQMPAAARSMAWSRASDVLLKYRGGAPFLSRFDRGAGSIYLMAAPLHESYSTLPNHALLVPVMYRLALSSYKQAQQLAYFLNDGAVQLPVPMMAGQEGIYALRRDTISYVPEQQVRDGRLYFQIPPGMEESGFYTLQLRDSVLATLAFNYDKEESYLDQYSPDDLRALVGKGRPQVHVYDYGDAFSVKGAFEKRYFGVKLWKYCLILCLLFLMAEIALIRFL